MNKKMIDRDGLILCEIQAKAFESSADRAACSSDIFVRRFMNSDISKILDNGAILDTNIQHEDILAMIEEQYGPTSYGKVKYTHNELYWMGYVYRYLAYTYSLSSLQAYKIVKPKELRDLFLPYHTLDPAQAVERILEAKNLLLDEEAELMRQYEIFRRIRNEKIENI